MSTFDESQHPRGRAGQFREKTNDAPDGALTPREVYIVHVQDSEPLTLYGASDPTDAIRKLMNVMPGITVTGIEVDDDDRRTLTICRHHLDAFPIDQLAERGLSIKDVDIEIEEVVELGATGDEPISLERIRDGLADSRLPVMDVTIARSYDDETLADIEIRVGENFIAGGEFTEDELNEHAAIVEGLYEEWFNASIDVPDSWDRATVTLRTDIAAERATESLIVGRAWDPFAKYVNETDPGTYGSPYVGAELRRRIDAKTAADAQESAFEQRILTEGR